MRNSVFTGQVVIITGASEGIGRELAIQLAGQKTLLVLASRNSARLEQVVDICLGLGSDAIAVQTDVSVESDCKRLIARATEAYGRIDMLINNAGVTMSSPFSAVNDPQLLVHLMNVNFFGAMYCTHYALPYLLQTRGRIVAVSSLAGRLPSTTGSGYVASKFAMRGFFDSLRLELKAKQVSVTTIYPGFVDTGVYGRFLGSSGELIDIDSLVPKGIRAPVDKCAKKILTAAARRKREVVMYAYGKLAFCMRSFTPRLLDRLLLRIHANSQTE